MKRTPKPHFLKRDGVFYVGTVRRWIKGRIGQGHIWRWFPHRGDCFSV